MPTQSTSSASPTKVPVTILTGFLGAGKTTLLNRILSEKHGKRIAVIENEYGEIGIDNDLIINTEEEIFEMNNGCLCCTVRGDLIRILGSLMKRRDKFDYILVETTGLADPGPVIQTFFADDDVREKTILDAVITVVDSKHVALHIEDSHECKEQIAFADVILLNKSDLVAKEQLDHLEHQIKDMNAVAKVIRTEKSNADIKSLLNVRAFDLERILADDPHFLGEDAHDHDHNHDHGHDHDDDCHDDHCENPTHHHHHHDPDVGSVGIELVGDLHEGRFNQWMGALLKERGADIYRTKGILTIKGQPKQLVFQGVHMLFDADYVRPWGATPRINRLVFIGKNLRRSELTEGLKRCLA